jgi:hypothetical protein
MGVIVKGLETPRTPGGNYARIRKYLGVPATCLGAPAASLGVLATSLEAPQITVDRSEKNNNILFGYGADVTPNHGYNSSFSND